MPLRAKSSLAQELPPFNAEAIGEHIVEAASNRVMVHWFIETRCGDRCYEDLMGHTRMRLEQEVARLGGDYAHVLDESIESRHNDRTGEGWLHGRFTYMLYRQPKKQ